METFGPSGDNTSEHVQINDMLAIINSTFNITSSEFINTNMIICNHNIFLRKSKDILTVSMIEKRGLYNCEDDVFYLKKNDFDLYEFCDIMNYVKHRIDTLENLVPILIQAIKKISEMRYVLQIHSHHKPALLDSPQLLFTIQPMRRCAIRYNSATKKILIISNNKSIYEYL